MNQNREPITIDTESHINPRPFWDIRIHISNACLPPDSGLWMSRRRKPASGHIEFVYRPIGAS